MKVHFLEQPPAKILQGEDVATPATNKPSKDKRRQDCQAKEDEARIYEPVLQRVHRFRGLDGGNRSAHYPPLDDVRDHEQIQKDQRKRAPPAGLRLTYACVTVARNADPSTCGPRNRSSSFQFSADATTFHRVGEFTSKRAVRYRADAVAIPTAANSKTIVIYFERFSLPFQSARGKHFASRLRVSRIHE